jgi:hypothetical protein
VIAMTTHHLHAALAAERRKILLADATAHRLAREALRGRCRYIDGRRSLLGRRRVVT